MAFLLVGSAWKVHTDDGSSCGTTLQPKKVIVVAANGISDACSRPLGGVQGWQFLLTIGGGAAGYAVARVQQTQRANRARASSTEAT